MNPCLIILNCKKHTQRRQQQLDSWLPKFPYKWYHIIADDNQDQEYIFDEKNKFICVKCPDDYVSLPKKTYLAIKAVRETFPEITHILKTDDNMNCKFDKFEEMLVKIKNYDYGGHIFTHLFEKYSTWHYRNVPNEYKVPQKVLNCCYCSGKFYFLSTKAADFVLQNKEEFWTYIYEDNIVGYVVGKSNEFKYYNFSEKYIFEDF